MPQESLRSVVYRSFVTCDDPKGVVECGTIRKSKTGSQKMKHKIEFETQQASKESSSRSFASKTEKEEEMVSNKGGGEEFCSSSSSQLLEVSRGAHKLNQMIGSWSRGMSFDGQSEDVAKDLLKGALDLQESLVMLGKLQEASKYMARLKKQQQKEKARREMVDEMGVRRSRSDRFMDQNYHHGGSQRPRLSVDGSSRDCIEELRQVITDSFARQNLLPPNRTTEERASFHQRSFDSDLEMPSTSSSQTSTDHSNRFGSTVSSLSPSAPQKKAKGPNLIAKLMGLEEIQIPSKPLQTMSQRQAESDQVPSPRRPIFDTDMPKVVRKPQYAVQKVDREPRTLREILETVQFKELLKGDRMNELKPQSHHITDARSRYRMVGDIPPIVLIKPIRSRWQDYKSPETPLWKEETLNTKNMLRKLKVQEEHLPEMVNCKERTLNNKMHRKRDEEKTTVRRHTQEVGKDCKEGVRKPDNKVVKTKGMASSKLQSSETINHKQQKKEAVDKKVDKIQKVASASRKPVEKETVKSQRLSRSQDQARVTKTNPGKSDKRSNFRKLPSSEKQNNTPHFFSKRTTQPVIHNSSDRKKNRTQKEKPKKKPTLAEVTTENLVCVEDKKINLTSENDSTATETTATLADQLTMEEETDSSELQTEEDCRDSPSALCSATLLTPEHEWDTKTAEEALDHDSRDITDSKSLRTRTNLETFLLGSPSFLSHVEELFDLIVSCPLVLQTSDINNCGVASAELSLDCANELVKRRSLPDSKTIHPLLLACTGNPRMCISLDQLVEEVCDGVETLKSYAKLGGGNLVIDNLYAILERELMSSNGLVSGTWDLGWRNGFSVDEAEQVVNDIEKLLLSGLIDEAFA